MAINAGNSFRTRDKLNVGAQTFDIHRLEFLEKQGVADLAKLPFSLRILLENLVRCEDGRFVHAEDIRALGSWRPGAAEKEITGLTSSLQEMSASYRKMITERAEDSRQLKEDTKQLRADTQRLKVDRLQLKEDARQLEEDTRQLKGEGERLSEDTRQLKAATERLKKLLPVGP